MSTTGKLTAGLSWVSRDIEGDGTDTINNVVTDIGDTKVDYDLTSGSGDGKVNVVFHNTYTLGTRQSHEFNLRSLSSTLFGRGVTTYFSNVKGLMIKNRVPDEDNSLAITATGANPFDAPFNGGSGNVEIPAFGALHLMNPSRGWQVETDNANFQIFNLSPSSQIQYDIAIIGLGSGS